MTYKVQGQRSPRWALWKWFHLSKGGQPYLDRLRVVQTPLFAVYLHWIRLPDQDRDPHDHPWWFASLVLRGGYTERRYITIPEDEVRIYYGDRMWRRWSRHVVRLDEAHRIDGVLPGTVTLVLTGPRRRDWGFWTHRGFVNFREYEEEHS